MRFTAKWSCDLCGTVMSHKQPCVLSDTVSGLFCSTVCMAVESVAKMREDMDAHLAHVYQHAGPAGRVKMRGKLADVRDRRFPTRTQLEDQASRRWLDPGSCMERNCKAAQQVSRRCAACHKKKRVRKLKIKYGIQRHRIRRLQGQ